MDIRVAVTDKQNSLYLRAIVRRIALSSRDGVDCEYRRQYHHDSPMMQQMAERENECIPHFQGSLNIPVQVPTAKFVGHVFPAVRHIHTWELERTNTTTIDGMPVAQISI